MNKKISSHDADPVLDGDLARFEERLRLQTPAPAPDTLGFRIAGALADTQGGGGFSTREAPAPDPVPAGRSARGRGRFWVSLAAAAVLVFCGILLLGPPGGETADPTAAATPESEAARTQPVGLDREVVGVEGLGLVEMDDGRPYEGYRLRIRDTGHWRADDRRSIHVSRDGEGTLLVPVVYY